MGFAFTFAASDLTGAWRPVHHCEMTLTYWGYHLIFTLPLIAVLGWWVRKRIRLAHVVCWLVTLVIVFIATTPWDNYAAAIGIWGFGEGVSFWYPFADMAERTRLLGHIPFEEYAFFGIQATLVILLTIRFLPLPADEKNPD